ncbi:hypothetical protein [Phascolarctobacterium sp.]|uniref:hypothetical protein n=1 Tax=Phascolarctobacterium sp. TaxID=2049039 RepID=UPI00386581EA
MDEEKLQITTNYLFNRDYAEETTEEQDEALQQTAKEQIAAYGWEATFKSWYRYLLNNCQTPEEAINFAHLFWCYGGAEGLLPNNPYQFLGYLYYCIHMDTETYDDMDILDSLAITILPKAGYQNADLYKNPYYVPENDTKLLEAVESWRSKLE